MPQKLLDRPQIGPGAEKMRGEAVPERMGRDFDPVVPAQLGQSFLNAPRPHAPAALANEQGTIPSVEEEDLRRSHRERDRLVRKRTAHINRIKGLLFGPLPFP